MISYFYIFVCCLAQISEGELGKYTFSSVEMAVPVKITLYAESETLAAQAAEAAFWRFRDLNARLSDYRAESELRRFCDEAYSGEFRRVSQDLWNVLRESTRVAKLSDGAFDPTVGQVVRLWRRARMQKKLPPEAEITAALETVGYENLLFDEDNRAIALVRQGTHSPVRIDLGGIAKGYAIDAAIHTLRTYGITRVLVDAGGDVGVGDPPPDADAWKIAVVSPADENQSAEFLYVSNCGLANSGDLSQFLEIDGVRYSHLVDPKTGHGLTHRATVSVTAPTAVEADALASAVSVLGPVLGISLVETLPGVETSILQPAENEAVTATESSGWKRYVR